MSTIEIAAKIAELQELEALIEEAKAEADSIRDTIKAEMNSRGVEEMEVGTHIVRYTSIVSNRFDSTAFKKALPEVYKAYTKVSTSRRFTISGKKRICYPNRPKLDSRFQTHSRTTGSGQPHYSPLPSKNQEIKERLQWHLTFTQP